MRPIIFYHHTKNYKLLMSGFRENVQKRQILTVNLPLSLDQDFFHNFGPVTLLLYWPLTSYKVSEKTNERWHLKKDRQMDGWKHGPQTRAISMGPFMEPGVQNEWENLMPCSEVRPKASKIP